MVFFPLLPLLINGYQDLYNSPMGFLIDGDALHHIAILQVSYMACFYLPLLPRTCRLHLADVPASYPPIRLFAAARDLIYRVRAHAMGTSFADIHP